MNPLKKLASFCGRVWAYLPVIWNDVDYDYGSILKVMQFKIKRNRMFIEKLEANYGLVEHEALCDKWGDIIFVKGPHGSELKHAKETAENKAELNADVKRVIDIGIAQEEADWKMLWEYLSRYMRGWWD